MQITPTRYIVPTGSASTHSGFLVGVRSTGDDTPVHGVCVRRNAELQFRRVRTKIDAVLETIGTDLKIADTDIICDDSMLAPGYGLPSEETVAAIRYLARKEGILLDPTYSGKTFGLLLGLLKRGEFGASDQVVFLHTGGTPSLFGYPELAEALPAG
jgi:1-aminocyclopropane-1-carboxylate deaminase/D-cysteine desulfhydrase-like pyridoxal-dependent ACC family enzyme